VRHGGEYYGFMRFMGSSGSWGSLLRFKAQGAGFKVRVRNALGGGDRTMHPLNPGTQPMNHMNPHETDERSPYAG